MNNMLYFRKIHGNSMSPTLNDGDFILALKLPQKMYHINDIIIVNHQLFDNIIKRIHSIHDNTVQLKGDGQDSLSTLKMGEIPTRHILGKMIWHISPKSKN
jgi:phage repressor protein C with HTH and peptisase S24 domain